MIVLKYPGKFIILSFLFTVSCCESILTSQTFISPVLGYDFQKVVSSDPFPNHAFDIAKSGYSYTSPIVGIKIRQKLIGPIYFGYLGDYTCKEIQGYFIGGNYQNLIYHYNHFRNYLSLIYLWNNKFYFGIGPTFNIVLNLNYEDIENKWELTMAPKIINEKGLMFSAGIKYKKYDFEVYYYIRKNEFSDNIYYDFLSEIYSLGFRFSYEFKILNGIKKKKNLECPDIKN